jgi:four helix bundle protein
VELERREGHRCILTCGGAAEPPVRKDFSFYNQLRDAAASPRLEISRKASAGRTHADFARFLDVARGSLAESQNHLRGAIDRGYLSETDFKPLHELAERSCGGMAALQRYLRSS